MNAIQNIIVNLPPLRKHRKVRRLRKNRGQSNGKKRLMSPLVLNRTQLKLDHTDLSTKYDEEKYLIYSVFRQKIQDEVLRPLVKEIVKESIENYKPRESSKKKSGAVINGRKIDPEVLSNFKYHPHNKNMMKLKVFINKDYDKQK